MHMESLHPGSNALPTYSTKYVLYLLRKPLGTFTLLFIRFTSQVITCKQETFEAVLSLLGALYLRGPLTSMYYAKLTATISDGTLRAPR